MEKTVGKQPNRSAFLRQPGKEAMRLKLVCRVVYFRRKLNILDFWIFPIVPCHAFCM